jgi:hypothetical protein
MTIEEQIQHLTIAEQIQQERALIKAMAPFNRAIAKEIWGLK